MQFKFNEGHTKENNIYIKRRFKYVEGVNVTDILLLVGCFEFLIFTVYDNTVLML